MKTYLEKQGTEVIRVGLQSTEDFDAGRGIVGGPYAPAFGELVVNYQVRQHLQQTIEEHREVFEDIVSVKVEYTRAVTSKVRGLKNSNILYFMEQYGYARWEWKQYKEGCTTEAIRMTIDSITYSITL